MSQLPFSQASENNKLPILQVLQKVFSDSKKVLEIGSGTGQHAVFFAEQLPHLSWIPSDRPENLGGIQARLNTFPQKNITPLQELDVTQAAWPTGFDAVFSANTAHIMPWEITQIMLKKVSEALPKNGTFTLYGPFNYNGEFTSPSNASFDVWLKTQAPHQGIRHFEEVNQIVSDSGLSLLEDNSMPANNRLLVWRKS